ncbi:MAG: DUF2254 domain-containing protein [Actinomycetota bacterium]|nr:DUF2254 domain-containing protein [Actinomycetota bacterium]
MGGPVGYRSGVPGSLVGDWIKRDRSHAPMPTAPHNLTRRPRRLRRQRVSGWRREALRTTLWLVPTAMVIVAAALFTGTYAIDRAAADGLIRLPGWINTDGADAARQVLIGVAAAVITVAGVVFSITILALTLASQQFGPRMLRNFIRDRGTQFTLGAFVSTFVYSVLTLGSVSNQGANQFVPNLSIAVALALTLGSVLVLIYFIHHVATSIQLTAVMSSIAGDFQRTVDELFGDEAELSTATGEAGLSVPELLVRLDHDGVTVAATASGFLQAVGHRRLVRIASSSEAVIRLLNRPGHFLVEGRPLAVVWPADAAPKVARALGRAQVVGPHRTLTQDLGFAVDQLVEIALRALSPAVNDTFTALNCIDWLGDGLCKISARDLPDGIYRDGRGLVRLIDPVITYERLVKGAFDKIRQAGRGMPAVSIRQLQNLEKILQYVATDDRRGVLTRHAEMIVRASEESVLEINDRLDVNAAYDLVVQADIRAP